MDKINTRDYFAAKAMHAILQASTNPINMAPSKLTSKAYEIADAMLLQRTGRGNTGKEAPPLKPAPKYKAYTYLQHKTRAGLHITKVIECLDGFIYLTDTGKVLTEEEIIKSNYYPLPF